MSPIRIWSCKDDNFDTTTDGIHDSSLNRNHHSIEFNLVKVAQLQTVLVTIIKKLLILEKRFMITIDFNKSMGLVPVIVQDFQTNEVLMLAWMNDAAYQETLRTRTACFFSRSRNKLWRKGEQSGHVQLIKEILVDCDQDTILLKVEQIGGAACHTGHRSCFYRALVLPENSIQGMPGHSGIADSQENILEEKLSFRVIGEPIFDPATVYQQS